MLLFSSLQLVQLSSLELPYWDRSPATLVVLTCKILLVRVYEKQRMEVHTVHSCSLLFELTMGNLKIGTTRAKHQHVTKKTNHLKNAGPSSALLLP